MSKFDDLINKIKANGIKRVPRDAKDLPRLKQGFCMIADAMIKAKDPKESFDAEIVSNEIDTLLNWTFAIEQEGLNLHKGLLFKGEVGKGKTFLLKVWENQMSVGNIRFQKDGENVRLSPQLVNVKRIGGEYQDKKTGGYGIIMKYAAIPFLILDDIGTEPETSKSYGNGINVIEEIINLREENNMLTFATTNKESLSDLYDDRTIRRMGVLMEGLPFTHDKKF